MKSCPNFAKELILLQEEKIVRQKEKEMHKKIENILVFCRLK
jgi:hypothetical protein